MKRRESIKIIHITFHILYVFHVQMQIILIEIFFQAFLVDIYSRCPGQDESAPPDHIGMCYIYPDNLKQTIGSLSSPITSMKFQPIGKLTGRILLLQNIFQEQNLIKIFAPDKILNNLMMFQLTTWSPIQLQALTRTSPCPSGTTGLMIGKVLMQVTEVLATHTPRVTSKLRIDCQKSF